MDSLQPAPDPGNQRQKMAEIVEKETLLGGQGYSSFVDERSLQSRSFLANRNKKLALLVPHPPQEFTTCGTSQDS